jgi:hypothetical protein
MRYQQRHKWLQTEQNHAPVPLRSKNEYESAQSSYDFHYMGPRKEPLRVDLQRGGLLGMEDDHP